MRMSLFVASVISCILIGCHGIPNGTPTPTEIPELSPTPVDATPDPGCGEIPASVEGDSMPAAMNSLQGGLLVPKDYTVHRTGTGDLALQTTEDGLTFDADNIVSFGTPKTTADMEGRYISNSKILMSDADGNDIGFDPPFYVVSTGVFKTSSFFPHTIPDNRRDSVTRGGYLWSASQGAVSAGTTSKIYVGAVNYEGDILSTDGLSSTIDTIDPNDGHSGTRHTALVAKMDTARTLYLFYTSTIAGTGETTLNVMSYVGGTWTLLNRMTLWTTGTSRTIRKVRALQYGSNYERWVVLVSAYDNANSKENVYQYAGLNPTDLEYVGTVADAGWAEISYTECEVLYFTVEKNASGAYHPYVRRTADVYQPIAQLTKLQMDTDGAVVWASGSGSSPYSAGMGVARRNDGELFVYGGAAASATGKLVYRSSLDGGQTWSAAGVVLDNDTVVPRTVTAVELGTGQIELVTNMTSDSTKLYRMRLGGWSDRTLANSDVVSSNDMDKWTPFALPDVEGWTKSGSGMTVTLNTGNYLRLLSGGSGESVDYEMNVHSSSTAQPNRLLYFNTYVDTALPNDTTPTGYVKATASNTSVAGMRIDLYKSKFIVWDTNTTLGSLQLGTVTIDGPLDFIVYFDIAGELTIWYRNSTAVPTLREYTKLTYTLRTTGGSTTVGDTLVNFGTYTNKSGSALHVNRFYNQSNYSGVKVNPDLNPKRIGAYSTPSWLLNYALVAPSPDAIPGDTWSISTSSSFSVDRALPLYDHKPLFGWRSTETGTQKLIFHANDEGENAGAIGGWYLKGINFTGASLYRYYDGAYTLIAPVDNTRVFSFVRQGRVLTPIGSGDVSAFKLRQNELVGLEVLIGSSRRTITENTSGEWKDGSMSPATITLSAVSSDATSGSATLIYSDVLVMFDGSDPAQYYKLEIPSQTTTLGYFKAKIMPGTFYPFLWPYDNGRILQSEHNIEVRTYRAGGRERFKRGERRHAVEFAWVQTGIDESFSEIVSMGDLPLGMSGHTVWTLRGLIETIQEQVPVVYASEMPDTLPATLYGRDTLLYGFAVGDVQRLEQVLGNPGREVWRIPAVRIEEEL